MNVPEPFAWKMRAVYGAAGAAWLARLPRIAADCARRWSLTIGPPFAPLSYNYVASVTRADGTTAVLKLGFPCRELHMEIAALRLYAGRGCACLLAADGEQGACLLEQLDPGTPLSALADDVMATAAAAAVMRVLWRPVLPDHPFPTTADWFRGFARLRGRHDGGSGPLPAALVNRAERLFAELLATSAEPVLLHGDLHHDNILAAGRAPWLAIDPKGLVGEPAYEVGALLRNPHPRLLREPSPGRVLARRLVQFADALGYERERLRDWGLAQAVLSACWSLEDSGNGWEREIACAELLAAIEL